MLPYSIWQVLPFTPNHSYSTNIPLPCAFLAAAAVECAAIRACSRLSPGRLVHQTVRYSPSMRRSPQTTLVPV